MRGLSFQSSYIMPHMRKHSHFFYEALGLHRPDRADPAEALLIEYFKRGGKYFVRFVQKNKEEENNNDNK